MFQKLLVATDLTSASNAVLSCLGELQRIGLEEVILAHVLYVANTPGLEELLAQTAAPQLERQRQALESQGIAVRTDMRLGVPAYTLADLADEHGVSAIVVGSHSKGLLRRMLAGSVSLGLLNLTARPVLLVRLAITQYGDGERCELACDPLFRRILLPNDFSDTARRASRYLEHIVGETHSRVTLLHVQDQVRLSPHLMHRLEEFNEIDRKRLEGLKARLLDQGARDVEIDIQFGSPLPIILARARQGDYSLILMGSQGRGAVEELLLGSVANGVARRAPLPVLFIPASR